MSAGGGAKNLTTVHIGPPRPQGLVSCPCLRAPSHPVHSRLHQGRVPSGSPLQLKGLGESPPQSEAPSWPFLGVTVVGPGPAPPMDLGQTPHSWLGGRNGRREWAIVEQTQVPGTRPHHAHALRPLAVALSVPSPCSSASFCLHHRAPQDRPNPKSEWVFPPTTNVSKLQGEVRRRLLAGCPGQ